MLSTLVSLALRQRILVLVSALGLLLVGIYAAQHTPLDVFPEFARPLIEVQTEAQGLSTPEVEALITVPIEAALAGVPDLETMRSKSVLGLSSVTLLLREGADPYRARQLVQERLALETQRLPAVARPPVILPPLSSLSRAMKIGLTSKKLSRLALSALLRFTIRPRLLAVPGVANVSVWGQRDRQLQVIVQPDVLRSFDLSIDQIAAAVREATTIAAGGFLDTANQRLALRHVGVADDAPELAQQPLIQRGGAALRIGDVATVRDGHAPAIGDAVINGQEGLLLIVEKEPTANTLEVTYGVEAALRALAPALSDVEIDPAIFRPASFIEQALRNLRGALIAGCVLVIAVLLLFLRDLRAALISLAAIPLSLTAALVVLWLRGGTLNTMFLAGLVIAIGEVVDDAIIDVENIRRRLAKRVPDGPSPFSIVLAASLEVRSAVVYATLIVSLVLLPVLMLDGIAGAFFRPLAQAYVLAVLASLAVALMVTPALSLLLLPQAAAHSRPPFAIVEALRRAYLRILPRVVSRPRLALGIVLFSTLLGAGLLPFLGDEFLPKFKETNFLMHWIERPGASVEASRRSTERISRELLTIPGVRSFGSHIGRAEVGDEVVGPNFTEHWIAIDPHADYDRTVRRVEEVVAAYPGVWSDVLTYLKERIKEVLSGASATIVVRIYGPEVAGLRKEARGIADALRGVRGVSDLKIEPQIDVPQIDVRLRPERAALHGLSAEKVRHVVQTMVSGFQVGEVYPQARSVSVVLWGDERARADLAALRRVIIDAPTGERVELGDIADLVVVSAPNEIKREGGSRRLDVTCNVRGRDLGAVARDVENIVRARQFPSGYHPELLGEYAAHTRSRRRILWLSALALLVIFGLLYLDFRSVRLALLLFTTLPFALLGGVIGVLLSGGVLSLGSIVGFISVLGIAARNGIMLVSHYRHLQREEAAPWGLELIRRGAEERLTPILMTASCAGLSLLPIVVSGNIPGYEIEHPMAVVIIGGLLSSTLLNLLLLPALYSAYGERR